MFKCHLDFNKVKIVLKDSQDAFTPESLNLGPDQREVLVRSVSLSFVKQMTCGLQVVHLLVRKFGGKITSCLFLSVNNGAAAASCSSSDSCYSDLVSTSTDGDVWVRTRF